MNHERSPSQPEEGAASSSLQRKASRDQADYRGPLKDPTKQPMEEVVRPPPTPKPWGVSGDDFPLSAYLEELNEIASRTPQFLARLIRTTPYLAQIESAQEYPQATAELVLRRRIERRWLRSYLGKREFLRRRRQGEFLNLFGWPRSIPRGASERITADSNSPSRDAGFPPGDQG